MRDQVERELPVERVADARLEVRTAHSFQGDARDVMPFSLCVGSGMLERARQFLRETGNLINVAISRAHVIAMCSAIWRMRGRAGFLIWKPW